MARGQYGAARHTILGAEPGQPSNAAVPIMIMGAIGAVMIAVVRDENRAAKAR
jgi:hypothetical protein